VGRALWLRADPEQIELYDQDFSLVKSYQRRPGRRFSDPEDFPENVQAMMRRGSVKKLLAQASCIGPYTHRYLQSILQPHAMRNMRKAMGVISLAEKHPREHIESAARQALAGKVFTWRGFRALLESPQAELPIRISPDTQDWVRPGDYFTHPNTNPKSKNS